MGKDVGALIGRPRKCATVAEKCAMVAEFVEGGDVIIINYGGEWLFAPTGAPLRGRMRVRPYDSGQSIRLTIRAAFRKFTATASSTHAGASASTPTAVSDRAK